MTAKELIQSLQSLGEENQDKEIVIFDGPAYCSPSRILVLDNQFHKLEGKILID